MRYQAFINALTFISALSSTKIFAADDPKKILQQIADCLDDKGLDSDVCKKTKEYLTTHKAEQHGKSYFLEDEIRIRAELKAKGLDLPVEIIPVGAASMTIAGNEAIAVLDWSYGSYEVDAGLPGKRQQAEWLSYKTDLIPPATYWDGGSYNTIHFYTKPKSAKDFKYSNSALLLGEYITNKSDERDKKMSLAYWFLDSAKPSCTGTAAHPVLICVTNYWSKDWPEFHVWNDARASSGLVMNTYVFHKGYKKVLDDNGHFGKMMPGANQPVLFIAPPTGESYNKNWAYAGSGAVYKWNPETKAMQKSEQLTKRLFPAIKKKIGSVPDGPTKAGYFLDKSGSLYLFSK